MLNDAGLPSRPTNCHLLETSQTVLVQADEGSPRSNRGRRDPLLRRAGFRPTDPNPWAAMLMLSLGIFGFLFSRSTRNHPTNQERPSLGRWRLGACASRETGLVML